jgi:RNA 2',3'-cyclic 3'-phosphodiesterase
MRLFVALDINDDIRQRISEFAEEMRGFAPQARWVRPESLHVTLKFIGEQSPQQCDKIEQTLKTVSVERFPLSFRGYGFFPNPRAPRVFWIGIEAGVKLASLAASVETALVSVGMRKEDYPYSPHLTLARSRGGSGAPRQQKSDRINFMFQQLHEKLSTLPAQDFGTMTAREFSLYQSQLSRVASKYTKLASFTLP